MTVGANFYKDILMLLKGGDIRMKAKEVQVPLPLF